MNPPRQSLSCFPFYKVTGYVTNSHWMGSHTNTRLPQQFIKLPWQSADTHIYSWVGRGNVEVKCDSSPLDGKPYQHKVTPAIHQASLTIHRYTYILLGWKRKCEGEVYCPRTQHNDPTRSRTQTSQPRPQCTNHSPTTSPIAVWVRIVLKRIVVGRNDWCFNNQAVSYYGLWLSKCQSPQKTTDLYKATSTWT